ncbi:hypothetical protein GCM10009530_64870 [Microbispora corallina]|uniref:Uncharacterized protein n=1 Tax=Microbispora corallina TaxID=83302 RepID=A0ABQ4G3I6_9ACTN|nr:MULTISPECIES: hypothetical protein [Microbispora]ETK37407.1 hypothetical protein MPTA5024_04335 [Microbispora sp. ATCC PTA-5024]GIH41625.1 hypothetical protein Mco01_46250 [Microbispora corallina]
MARVLITVRLPEGASLESAMSALGLEEDEVDTGYGLVPVDPGGGLYALRVSESAGRRVGGDGAAGPHADPPIEPFGPPR